MPEGFTGVTAVVNTASEQLLSGTYAPRQGRERVLAQLRQLEALLGADGECISRCVQPREHRRRREALGQRKNPYSFIQPEREHRATSGNTRRDFVCCWRTVQKSPKQQKTLAAQGLQGLLRGGDCWTRTSDLLRVKQAL